MNGNIACGHVIFFLIQITAMMNQGYEKAILIGHSSDDGKDVLKAFNDAGTSYFFKKPPLFNKLNELV